MSRLFITPREVDFISDITKEIVKDVIGQKIYFYKVRQDLTPIHDVYEESSDKVFNPPVEVDCLVAWGPADIYTGKFGGEAKYTIEVNLQERDILDRDIDIQEGDFFSYGDTFYEIIKINYLSQVYGQIEHSTGIKLTGKQAREGMIDFVPLSPTSEAYLPVDENVQETFVQQRGFKDNKLGPTGDVRSLQKKNVLTKPISGPAEVSPQGGTGKKDEAGIIDSAFYGDS